jgi:hypothetical protein
VRGISALVVVNTFSKRQKRLRGEVSDVYRYDIIPPPLKTQIVHIWHDALGSPIEWGANNVSSAYSRIVGAIRREIGVFVLPGTNPGSGSYALGELTDYFLNQPDPEQVLDVVEITFRGIDRMTRRYEYLYRHNASEIADRAIDELNQRFREHVIGYQFTNGDIVRVDSEFIHSEVVVHALHLLGGKHYEGAQEEFLKAHEHYRHGNTKEALNECLKALESVMKAICVKRNWLYNNNSSSKALIQICFENDLIPPFWQQHFASLRAMLESGVPTGRNKLSGHGQGASSTSVPDYIAAYMLHMTASSIVFLAGAELHMPQ